MKIKNIRDNQRIESKSALIRVTGGKNEVYKT